MAGRKGGKRETSRCGIDPRPDREEIDTAILSSLPLETIASQHPGTSKSALGRHKLKCLRGSIIRAAARAAPPPPDFREVEVFEDRLLAEMLSLHKVTREELEAARKGLDRRLVVVLLGQVRENIVALGKWLPANDGEPVVIPIRMTFPKSHAARHALEDAAVRDAAPALLADASGAEAPTSEPAEIVEAPAVTQPPPLDANDPRPYDARIDSGGGDGARRWAF